MPRKNVGTQTKNKYDNGTKMYPDIKEIIEKSENVKDEDKYSIDRFFIGEHIYLDVCFTESGNDTVQLNMFGVCIKGRIVKGKEKYFISLPQYKNNKGDWVDLVTIYNKELYATISDLLQKLYE